MTELPIQIASRAPGRPSLASVPMTSVVIGMPSPVLLCALESMVRLTPGVRFVGAAHALDEFLRCCSQTCDGLALADPSLGDRSMHDFMDAVRRASPELRVVLMTDCHQPHALREAVKKGAYGLIGKSACADEIRAAMAAATTGRRYISTTIAAHLAESLTLEELTNREMQVLALLAQGACNKSIARGLDLTVGTVKTHVHAIMSKLRSHSRTEAAHKAYRLGLA
jgi:DNA-binding NarL/FixJ family response regulator